jgi:hypothetical protein
MKYIRRTIDAQTVLSRAQGTNNNARHVPGMISVFPSPNLTPAPSRCCVAGVRFYKGKTEEGHMAGSN